MLKNKLNFLLITLLVVSVSCQKDEINEGQQELPVDAQATLDYLTKDRGYSLDDIVVDHDARVFNIGDMSFDFAQSTGIAKNRFVTVPLYFSNSRSVSYYFESDFPQNYRTPLAWAAWHWSGANSNINIRSTTNKSEADIILSTFNDSNTDAWARAGLPSGNGNVGNFLNVNVAKNHASLSSADKMVLMIHELGHNLGFEHADQNYGMHIPGTNNTTYHQNNNCGSIMKSSVFTCGWTLSTTPKWSADDLIAIEWAY